MAMHRIEVTQADIDDGQPGNARSCALANAIRRHARAVRVEVLPLEIRMLLNVAGGKLVVAHHRRESSIFVRDFDKRKSLVRPCTIELEWE